MESRNKVFSMKHLLLAMTLCSGLPASATEHEITGSDGNDRLVGTPGTDQFIGGEGADVFVINYLSAEPDEILDFDPAEGDTIELTFESGAGAPFKQEFFSINRKGVVKFKVGNQQQDVVRLNQTDLKFELDPRKGRYFLKFSKKF